MLIQELLKRKSDFSIIEKKVADYFLEHQDKIENQSARYIANQIFTAPSTIVRLCQKMGFQGYTHFRKEYIDEIHYLQSHFINIDPNYPFEFKDTEISVAHKIRHLYQNTLGDIVTLFNEESLEKVVSLIMNANNIYIFSSGVQVDIAKAFKDKMLKIGKSVIVESKMDEAYYIASFSDISNVCLMISYSGETEILLRVARKLKKRKIPMISMTSYGDNSLSKMSDEVIYVSTREKLNNNLGDFGMNLSVLYVLDVLYAICFNGNYRLNYNNKIEISHGFQVYRNSENPMLNDQVAKGNETKK